MRLIPGYSHVLCHVQVVAHLVSGYNASSSANAVDGDPVPVPHFGAALSVDEFHELEQRLKNKGVQFVIEVRGEAGRLRLARRMHFFGLPAWPWCHHSLIDCCP